VVAFHTVLGFVGYSKLLRYIILITPASILFPSLLVPHAIEWRSRQGSWFGRFELSIIVLATAGIVVEVATGINTALHVQRALIIPLTGL
jgi:hypothetical protein